MSCTAEAALKGCNDFSQGSCAYCGQEPDTGGNFGEGTCRVASTAVRAT